MKDSHDKAVLSAIRGEMRGDKMIDAKIIGERLQILRGTKTREEVANAVGVSISAMSMYENGERIPRDGIKIAFSRYYGKTVQEIFFDENVTYSDQNLIKMVDKPHSNRYDNNIKLKGDKECRQL